MGKLIQVLLISICACFSLKAQDTLSAHFDERIDLMAAVWRLAGASEYNNCVVTTYGDQFDEYFSKYTEHPAVKMASQLYSKGISYDAVSSYSLHFTINEDGSLSADSLLAEGSDTSFDRWSSSQKRDFLTELESFYKETRFHNWYVATEPVRKEAEDAFQTVLDNLDLQWLPSFFGSSNDSQFQIILSILNGVNNYGLSAKFKDGRDLVSPVMSSAGYVDGQIVYDVSKVLPIVVHEFCHAYCNPLVDKYWSSMSSGADKAYDLNRKLLSSLAYTNSRIMMYETLVRTTVIEYLREHMSLDDDACAKLVKEEEELGFILTADVLSDEIAYSKTGHTGLESYMPNICKTINGFSSKRYLAAKKAEEKSKVHYKTNVRNGSKKVAPGELNFTITFDRPMTESVSINVAGYEIPEVRGFSWSEDERTLTLDFYCEPGSTYGFTIAGRGFISKDGVSAVDTTIHFTTRK